MSRQALTSGLSLKKSKVVVLQAGKKKETEGFSVSFGINFLVQELISSQQQGQPARQQEQRQEQPARQQEQQQEQRQEQPAQQEQEQQQEPQRAVQLSERSQRKKPSSRGTGKRKVFS
jgi:hypothetical protein